MLYPKRDLTSSNAQRRQPGDAAVRVLAPAKINWTLRVIGVRADGYHEIESLVGPVSLYDELSFSMTSRPGVELACGAPGVPLDERNLITQAARRMGEAAGVEVAIECRLSKKIPVGGGLGGGSSNAASTLLALNRLWGLDWPLRRLADIGIELGSDVPLFLDGGPVIMRGRGECVEPASPDWHGWLVLVYPGVSISTAEVYKAWRAVEGPAGDEHGGRDVCPSAAGLDARQWMDRTFNMLEGPAMKVCPLLVELMDRLGILAGRAVRLSGSGSTLFTAFDTPEEARRFAAVVEGEVGMRTGVVRPLSRA